MGCWGMAKDRIEVKPGVNDALIKEFIEFSIISCPEEYCREKFANPWFFDSENKLVCHSGKFAEDEIWYRHLKKYFFRPRGYKVPDEISHIGDCDIGFWDLAKIRAGEYEEWKKRTTKIVESLNDYDTLFSYTGMDGGSAPLPRGFYEQY